MPPDIHDVLSLKYENDILNATGGFIQFSATLWHSGVGVLEKTISNIKARTKLIKSKLNHFRDLQDNSLVLEELDLDQLHEVLIRHSEYFFNVSSATVESLFESKELDNTQIRDLCQTVVSIINGRKSKANWDQTKNYLKNIEFLKQIYYYSSVISNSKYCRSKRTLKVLGLNESIIYPKYPKTSTQFLRNLIVWYKTLWLYLVTQERLFILYEEQLLKQHIADIEDDLYYMHSLDI